MDSYQGSKACLDGYLQEARRAFSAAAPSALLVGRHLVYLRHLDYRVLELFLEAATNASLLSILYQRSHAWYNSQDYFSDLKHLKRTCQQNETQVNTSTLGVCLLLL